MESEAVVTCAVEASVRIDTRMTACVSVALTFVHVCNDQQQVTAVELKVPNRSGGIEWVQTENHANQHCIEQSDTQRFQARKLCQRV